MLSFAYSRSTVKPSFSSAALIAFPSLTQRVEDWFGIATPTSPPAACADEVRATPVTTEADIATAATTVESFLNNCVPFLAVMDMKCTSCPEPCPRVGAFGKARNP